MINKLQYQFHNITIYLLQPGTDNKEKHLNATFMYAQFPKLERYKFQYW